MEKVLIPGSILLTGGIIALAVLFGGGGGTTGASLSTANGDFGNAHSADAASLRLPNEDDHMRGAQDPAVTIVEFSDFECPFCQRLHPTLTRIINEADDVQWVYRHFPLTSIHSRALDAAIASECIASLGGNEAFWSFADEAFANQSQLGNNLYERIARENGVDIAAFQECTNSDRFESEIAQDRQEAISSGGRGTPYVVVLNAAGDPFPFSGALPYEQVQQVINAARESNS